MISLCALLLLGGCAAIGNPLTINNVYDADAALGVAASTLNGYRKLCVQHNSLVYPKCYSVVPKLQQDLSVARGQIKQAVAYVKANPGNTVQVQVLLNQASASIAQLRADMAANGVQ